MRRQARIHLHPGRTPQMMRQLSCRYHCRHERCIRTARCVVESIVKMLGSAVGKHGSPGSDRTQEPAAYDFYLRGLGYLQDYHKFPPQRHRSVWPRPGTWPSQLCVGVILGEAYRARYVSPTKASGWTRATACSRGEAAALYSIPRRDILALARCTRARWSISRRG